MKQINQIVHLTDSKEVLKSILENGFFTSYAKEKFGKQNVLIPMISFANILFRDIGEKEVIDYGKYGIVFDRDYIIEKFDLNPVFYVKNESEIEEIFPYNFQTSIIPQTLHLAKDFYIKSNCKTYSEYICINPISDEVKHLLDTLDKDVNDDFIHSIKVIFENYFLNTMKQILLLKPFKVENKEGVTKIAYNEREWRKSFFDLHYISEIKPDGKINEQYEKWINTSKPHFTDKYILKFDIAEVQYVYVENENEVEEVKNFVTEKFQKNIEVFTLSELKEREI
jgi:uncharacterized protein YcgL (UPF0745 family)